MKRYSLVMLLLLLVSMTSLFGCSNPTSSGVNPWANFWPNDVGNSWEYEKTVTAETTFVTTETWTIVSAETILDNIAVKKILIVDASTTETITSYYKFDDTGVYNYSTNQGITDEPTVILSYPLYAGKTWEAWPGGISAEVVTIESVTTATGTFEAYKVVYGSDIDRWYASGVGQIKSSAIGGDIVDDGQRFVIVPITYEAILTGKNF